MPQFYVKLREITRFIGKSWAWGPESGQFFTLIFLSRRILRKERAKFPHFSCNIGIILVIYRQYYDIIAASQAITPEERQKLGILFDFRANAQGSKNNPSVRFSSPPTESNIYVT